MSFDLALNHTLGIEGGYSDDPRDSGGATMYGITEAVARANGYIGPMDQMSPIAARAIYRKQYWDLLRLDEIDPLSPAIALELFDTGVNCGVQTAAKMLQRALNALNREQADYLDVPVIGVVGPKTLHSLTQYLRRRGAEGVRVLVAALNALQAERYITLAENRAKDEAFVYGWLLNRVVEPAP